MVAWEGGEGRIGGSQRNQLMKALSGLKMSSAEFQVLPHLSVMNGTGLSVKGGNPWDARPAVMSWRCTVKMDSHFRHFVFFPILLFPLLFLHLEQK